MSVCATCEDRGDTYVIRSFRSLPFFRPPKAILVPGMYFLGFSRYSNCEVLDMYTRRVLRLSYQGALLPVDAFLLVRVGV